MSELKQHLLRLLEKNGRMTSKELSVIINEDESVIKKAIRELEDDHIICGYNALVNWDKVNDDDVSAVLEVKVTPQKNSGYADIAEKIYQHPEVEALYLMSGAYDFLIILRKSNMRAIAKFVNQLAIMDAVISTSTHVVLERYKDHSTILIAPKKDQRMAGMH